MLEALASAMQAQQVAEEKITFIINRLTAITAKDSDDIIWRTFCESCLEVGVDPQAVFALAVTNTHDAMDPEEEE